MTGRMERLVDRRVPTEMEDRVARAMAYPATATDAEWDRVKLIHAALYDEWIRKARTAIRAMREPAADFYDALAATDKPWRELNSTIVWQTFIDASSPPA